MIRAVRRRAVALACALVLGVGAAGCSTDDDDAGEADAPAETSPSAPMSPPAERTVDTKVSFGQVSGRLDREARQRLAKQVGSVVDDWTAAAYLGGDYPRRAFADSWPGFTAGAATQARRDRALMSNQDIGDRIDGVVPRRSVVVLDVLAVQGRPAGVTARMSLGFRTTGEVSRTVRVQGRLMLTRTDRGWRVFGYDVTKGAV
ncbi:MAG: hypothetical protein WBP61_08330 [Nocardioides sp.]